MEKDVLAHALREAGHEPIQLMDASYSSLLVLPYGARVLGLFPGDRANLLWVHPSLEDPRAAKKFLCAPGWRNTGGDRTWISPERDIHVRDLQDPWNSYEVTHSIDPGQYSVVTNDQEVRLTTKGSIMQHRVGQECAIRLEKTLRLIPNPLRYEAGCAELLKGVLYSGFEQTTRITYTDPKPEFQPLLSIWDSVNLPAAGTIIIPTIGEVRAKDFFELTGPSHLKISHNGLSFIFDGRERHKIGVRAADLYGGRAGYLRRIDEDNWTLVVRNFFVDPSAEYPDTPWFDPEDRGYVLECYNDSGLNGAYGELEYHSPAMGDGTGRNECFDRAQLWGFQGPRTNIFGIAGAFLGCAVVEQFIGKGTG